MISISKHTGKLCTVRDCLMLAKWVPYAVVKMGTNDNVFNIDFDSPTCDEHKKTLSITDIINPATMKAIQEMFSRSNLTKPGIDNMVLGWYPYSPSGLSLPIVNDIGELMGRVELSNKIKFEKV